MFADRLCRSGLLALLILPVVSEPLCAQVAEGGFALVTRSIRTRPGGVLRYEYALRNPAGRTDALAHVLIDVGTPRSDEPVRALDADARFLFDAVATAPDVERTHAPLGVLTPEGWWGAVYYTANVSWSASRGPEGGAAAVRGGQTLEGFALTSTALPGFRRFRILPHRRPADAAMPVTAEPDSSWVLREGYVIAPGYPAEMADGAYLAMQVEGACYFRALADCDGYRSLAERITAAEREGRQDVYLALVRETARRVGIERAMASGPRFVLTRTLAAMSGRRVGG